jgi:phosphomannomutase
MLAALHVLAALGETPTGTTLSQLLSQYTRYVASGEINSTVDDQAAVSAKVRATYSARPDVEIDELDGLTVTAPTWWFNLRPSNTEPLLRLNVEADDKQTLDRVRDEVLSLVRG